MEEIDKGFVKLYRKLLDNPIGTNIELLGLLTFFLLSANHKEKIIYVGQTKVVIKPGEFVSSSLIIANTLKISRTKLNRLIKILKDEGIADSKGTSKYTLYKLKNRHQYQGSGQQTDSKRTTSGQPADTNKNDKNEKNNKYIYNTHAQNFEKFRFIYPNKKQKQKTNDLFKKICSTNVGIESTILKSATDFKKYHELKKTEKRYIPYPTTRLNQKRWEDDLTEDIVQVSKTGNRLVGGQDYNSWKDP